MKVRNRGFARGGAALFAVLVLFAALAAGAASAVQQAFAATTTVTAQVTLTDAEGKVSQIPCTFTVTTAAKQGEAGTVSVGRGKNTGQRAVAASTAGTLTIPATIAVDGASFRVTAVGDYAFGASTTGNSYLCKKITGVMLPEGIASIGASAFRNCGTLTSVNIPSTVTSIGEYAFAASGITEAALPAGAETVGASAYANCTALSSVTLPAGMKSLGASAFLNCTALSSVDIPIGLTSLPNGVFRGCGFTRLSVPAGIGTIGAYALADCTALERIDFEGDMGAAAVDELAFSGDAALKTVVYRGTRVKGASFTASTPAQFLHVIFYSAAADGGAQAGGDADSGADGGAGAEALGNAYVKDGTALSKIRFGMTAEDGLLEGAVPAYPTGMNAWTFDRHAALDEALDESCAAHACYTKSDDLSACRMRAAASIFSYTGATIDPQITVTAPTGELLEEGMAYTLTYFRQDAAGAWMRTDDLVNTGTVLARADAVPESGYKGSVSTSFSIHLVVGSVFRADITLRSEDGGEQPVSCAFRVEGVDTSGEAGSAWVVASDGACAISPESAGAVVIPASVRASSTVLAVTGVGDGAFGSVSAEDVRCTGLVGAELPASVEQIGTAAFAGLSALEAVSFAGTGECALRKIADDAFAGCSALGAFPFARAASLQSIGARAFSGCTALTEVSLAESVLASIGEGAFEGCRELAHVELPACTAQIGAAAFRSCTSLERIDLPAGLESLGANAFASCAALSCVTVGTDGTKLTVGRSAFDGDYAIAQVVYRSGSLADEDTLFLCADVTYYQTVTFYETQTDMKEGKDAQGAAAVRRGTICGAVRAGMGAADGLFDGEVPAFTGANNMWGFPGDRYRAMALPLDASVSVYQTELWGDLYEFTNDGEGPQVVGLASSYEYTGSPVDMNWCVVGTAGGILAEGVDYTASYQRKSSTGVWRATNDLASPGSLRLLVKGAGAYSGSLGCEFMIEERSYEVGDVIWLPVSVTAVAEDAAVQISCRFQVTGTDDGVYLLSVVADETDAYCPKAIASSTAGMVSIPAAYERGNNEFRVTAVGAGAFGDLTANSMPRVTGVALGIGVESVGKAAFAGMGELASVTFDGAEGTDGELASVVTGAAAAESSLVTIGESAFARCEALASFELPRNVRSLGRYAFSACSALVSFDVTEDSKLSDVGEYTFNGCTSLRTFYLPAGLRTGRCAWAGTSIERFDVSAAWEPAVLPEYFFYNMPELTCVPLPVTLTTIGAYAAALCPKVTRVDIPAHVTSLGRNAFGSCNALETVVFLGDAGGISYPSVYGPFAEDTRIQSVVYRAGALNDTRLFSQVSPIFYVQLSFVDDLEREAGAAAVAVGTRVCDLATSPESVSVFDGAVPALPGGCNAWFVPGLSQLDGLAASAVATAGSFDEYDLSCAVVTGLQTAYRYTGEAIAPDLYVCSALGVELRTGADVSIGYERANAEGTWMETSDLASLGRLRLRVVPAAGSSFHGECTSEFSIVPYLTGDVFEAVNADGVEVSYSVLALSEGGAPGRVTVRGRGTGANVEAAVPLNTAGTLHIPDRVTGIGGFSYEVAAVGAYAFCGCALLEEVVLPSSVQSIGDNAFRNAALLTRAELPAAVEAIGSYAFYGCTSLTQVSFLGAADSISFGSSGSYESTVFGRCSSIRNVLYAQTKGVFCDFGTSTPTSYYLASWYASADARAAGEPCMQAYVKEGARLGSLGATDTLEGISTPKPPANMKWRYEEGSGPAESVEDVAQVWAVPVVDTSFIATATVTNGSGTHEVDCTFSRILDDEDKDTGLCRVGSGIDGSTAIDPSCAGLLTIPSVVEWNGARYTVRDVADFAFGTSEGTGACRSLTGIALPASVTSLGTASFMGCSALCDVTFASGSRLSSIGRYAFGSCTALARIELPASLTVLDGACFDGCTALAQVTVPAGVQTVGRKAFSHCTALTDVRFLGDMGAADAARNLFLGCTSLARVVFEGSACAINLPSAQASLYYTLRYYADEEAVETGAELSHIVAAGGSVVGAFAAEDILEGTVPTLPADRHWAYLDGLADGGELQSSGRAYSSENVYGLAVDGEDVFTVSARLAAGVRVDGEKVAAGAEVFLTAVTSCGNANVVPAAFLLADATGAVTELAGTRDDAGTLRAQFAMPLHEVTVRVAPAALLDVQVRAADGSMTVLLSTDSRQLAEALSDEPASYLQPSGAVVRTSNHLDLEMLLENVYPALSPDDTILFLDAEGAVCAECAEGVRASDLFSPSRIDNQGEPVSTVLALSCARGTGTESVTDAWTLLAGLPDSGETAEVAEAGDTVIGALSQVGSVVICPAGEDISACTVDGLEERYAFTGAEQCPAVQVTAPDGRKLQEDVDYTLSYEDNVQAGFATVRACGCGAWAGVLSARFRIVDVEEIEGDSRYATAAVAAVSAYPDGAQGVVVCTGNGFADALSAAGLAGMLDYPILLTEGEALSAAAADAIEVLAPDQAIIVGGESVVGAAVENALVASLGNAASVARLGGADRYDTAYRVLAYGDLVGTWSDTAVVAVGDAFPDALSISPFAAYTGNGAASPILLTPGSAAMEGMDAASRAGYAADLVEAVTEGGFSDIVVVGGEAAVSAGTFDALAALPSVGSCIRLAGADRYATSLSIATWAVESAGFSYDGAGIATGENFPDALAGGPVLGKTGSVLLLSGEENGALLERLRAEEAGICTIRFLGGDAAVSPSVRLSVVEALGWDGLGLREVG